MRVRHYPLITMLAGGSLVIVPALAVWFSTWLRSSESGAEVAASASIEAIPERQPTIDQQSISPVTEAGTVSENNALKADNRAVVQSKEVTQNDDSKPVEAAVFGGFVMADPGSTLNNSPEAASRIASLPSTTVIDSADVGLLNAKPDIEPEMPAPVVASESLYDATKHPALASLPTGSGDSQPAESKTSQPESARGASKSGGSSRRSGKRGERSPSKAKGNEAAAKSDAENTADADPDIDIAMAAGTDTEMALKTEDNSAATGDVMVPDNLKEIPDDGIGNPFMVPKEDPTKVDPNLIQDVVIQIPQENVPVGRVENLVAVTRATGWPVALVRSDLPDDVWWVQQMVGIQGNSFAARVNFGNEYSVSGTAYRMVIVFLDSQEEVRRFRIAKQFEQIPEGVRRSREYRYIRN